MEEFARVSGAESGLPLEVRREAETRIGPDKRNQRPSRDHYRIQQPHRGINTTSTLLCQVLFERGLLREIFGAFAPRNQSPED